MALCELPRDPVSSDEFGGTGGTCVLRGCVPKKLMSYAAHFAEDFDDANGFGYTRALCNLRGWTCVVQIDRGRDTHTHTHIKFEP